MFKNSTFSAVIEDHSLQDPFSNDRSTAVMYLFSSAMRLWDVSYQMLNKDLENVLKIFIT